MNTGPFRALVRKDIAETLRTGGLHIAMSLLGTLGFALIPVMTLPSPLHMQGAEAAAYRAALNAATNAQMPLLVIWIMTFAGASIVSNLMTREKTRKTMIPILCSGVTPRAVWAANTTRACSLCRVWHASPSSPHVGPWPDWHLGSAPAAFWNGISRSAVLHRLARPAIVSIWR